ncbi:MAG: ribose 5-phosphate isomerase B [Myxococcales bacterium]|nr:ribose 5-phosphate isomerase B [Myxococcales bacterium]
MGSDHGGVGLRRLLVEQMRAAGHAVVAEHGPADPSESCDYPDVAVAVCRAVRGDAGSLGLLVCGTGQGMAMSANRVRGIRAALVGDVFSARMAREHNDANVICMGERVVGPGLAVDLWAAFAGARFEGGRHARRVGKLDAIAGDGAAEPGARGEGS